MMDANDKDAIVLSGIKPTGRLHLGNYLGMIVPALGLAKRHRTFFFIADYHALITLRDTKKLTRRINDLAAAWLALGLNPERIVFYRQSAVPEVFELMWVLSCITAKGVLNRGHAYKAVVTSNQNKRRNPDADINAGLFNYPMLMAADILAFGARWVPVGRDQKQHVEIAQNAAAAFNQRFGKVLVVPEPIMDEEVETVIGIDGRKMSKSYGNQIPILAGADELRRTVMHIVTDSRRPEEPKDPEQCNLFRLYRRFAARKDIEHTRALYLHGGLAYKDLKEELSVLLTDRFTSARKRYQYYLAQPAQIDRVLHDGALKARTVARKTLIRIRQAIGIDTA